MILLDLATKIKDEIQIVLKLKSLDIGVIRVLEIFSIDEFQIIFKDRD